MAVYGYIRVSTAKQNTARQEDALQGQADEIFMDKVSGASTENRPEFQKLMAKIGKGDTLLVVSLDRAFRSLRDALDTIDRLDEVGAEIKSTDGRIDTSDHMGRAFFQVSAVFSEMERNIAAERREEGIEAAKKRGVQFGRPKSLNRQQVLHAHIQINREGKTVSEMAEVLGVSRSTLHRALKREDDLRAIPYDLRKLATHITTWCVMRDVDLFDTVANIHAALKGVKPLEELDIKKFRDGLEVARDLHRNHEIEEDN